jgi:hypothetical protein
VYIPNKSKVVTVIIIIIIIIVVVVVVVHAMKTCEKVKL